MPVRCGHRLPGFDLPAGFVLDGLLQETEAVEVLDFPPGTERGAGAAHRDVGVAAERAFLHVAVADTDPGHQRMQGLGVGHRLLGAAHVWFRHDLQQWRAGAVEVDAAHAMEIFVQRFPGVFFKMGAGEHERSFPGHRRRTIATSPPITGNSYWLIW